PEPGHRSVGVLVELQPGADRHVLVVGGHLLGSGALHWKLRAAAREEVAWRRRAGGGRPGLGRRRGPPPPALAAGTGPARESGQANDWPAFLIIAGLSCEAMRTLRWLPLLLGLLAATALAVPA